MKNFKIYLQLIDGMILFGTSAWNHKPDYLFNGLYMLTFLLFLVSIYQIGLFRLNKAK